MTGRSLKIATLALILLLAGCCTAAPPRSQWVFPLDKDGKATGLARPPKGYCGSGEPYQDDPWLPATQSLQTIPQWPRLK